MNNNAASSVSSAKKLSSYLPTESYD